MEAAFEQLQQELGKQQCLLLARLTELEQQIWKERDEYILRVTEEIARLEGQVKELEEKCQQPASALLQVRESPPPRVIGQTFHSKGTLCRGLEGAGERQEREVEIISSGKN